MEIRGGILQGKSKRIDALVESGHLEPFTEVLGGRFPVTVKGYVLTHLGRLEYCVTCDDEEEMAAPQPPNEARKDSKAGGK